MSLIPAGDAAGKLLMQDFGFAPIFVASSRFLIGFLLLVPFLKRRDLTWQVVTDWRILLRGVLIAAAVCSIVTALQTEGLATVFAAFFVGPILSYFLAVLFLGESIRPAQTALLFMGFLGVVIVVRPGFGMTPGLGLAVLAGVLYGAYLTTGRWIADRATPLILLAVQLAVSALVLLPFGLRAMPVPSPSMLPLLLISGAASMLGNLLLLQAYRGSGAARLAPLVYLQLVAATVLGFGVFGTWPDLISLLGIAVILAAGLGSFALRPRLG